ncbi:outer membrane protein assembly factor BamB family protein, partial [Streptomyces sp. NPDC004285]
PVVALSRVVQPYGAPGRSRDFGTAATDPADRPAGWSPWTARTDWPIGACALSPKVLVCTGSGGSAVGLSASDGRKLWAVPGKRATSPVGPLYPAVVDDTVYLSDAGGITAYGLADGAARGVIPVPDGGWAVKSTDLLDGVLYSSYFGLREDGTGLVTAVRLKDRRMLWRAAVPGVPEQVVAVDGRVLVPLGDRPPVALDAATGREAARATEPCGSLTAHEKSGSVLCWGRADRSVAVLDARTLKPRHTLVGVRTTLAPAVGADGRVALLDATGRLVTYDLADGRERWRSETLSGDRVYVAGDRVITASSDHVTSYPAGGKGSEEYRPNIPEGVGTPEFPPEVLAAGGAVFLAFPEGLVVSAYLP